MPRPLHVANGHATAVKLTEGQVPGRVVVHGDVLCDGPFPPDLPPSPAWHHRAAWMARHHGADGAKYLVAEMALERDIARHTGDLVLWSDAGCLHCALNLLHLLRLPTKARVLLVAPPGARLGDRPPAELAALVSEPVPAEHIALARTACGLVAAGDPAKLQAFANGPGMAAWPAMRDALRLRLRLPRLLDTAVLDALAQGPRPMGDVVAALLRDPALAGLGYGDASLALHVRGMAEAGLVAVDGEGASARVHARGAPGGSPSTLIGPR